ncbi:MAG: protein phosphatase 2C domain-containing protein [Cytophagales bacterium]|nr:protein phosphatase 2C domain-containing protein [Cytophagales bacterium]
MKEETKRISNLLNEITFISKQLDVVRQELFELLHESQDQKQQQDEEYLLEKQSVKIDLKKALKSPKNIEDMAIERENGQTHLKEILLKNGMEGKVYEDLLKLSLPEGEELLELVVEGLEDAGLELKEGNIVCGTLKKTGDFVWNLRYKAKGNEDEIKMYGKLHLTVLSNPQSLWMDKAPDSNAPYKKSNTHFEFREGNGAVLMGGSVRGRSHAHVGSFRDDHFCVESIEDSGWQIMAVSDGAGSAIYSRQGAKIACEQVFNKAVAFHEEGKLKRLDKLLEKKYKNQSNDNIVELNDFLYESIVGTAFSAFQKIKEEAASKEMNVKDYAATLLFTFIKPFDFGWIVISFWVGDGAICVLHENGFHLLGEPDGGEFAGQTRFVTMQEIFKPEEAIKRIHFHCFEEKPRAIILMTDGITDPKFGTDDNLNDLSIWESFYKELEENVLYKKDGFQQALEEWMNFWSPGNHDDRTIALAIPKALELHKKQLLTKQED